MRFNQKYLDELFTSFDYAKLAEISALICGSDSYKPEEPDYGLDTKTFVFIECLLWFAKGLRSGVWTYYEATSPKRQEAMIEGLRIVAPRDFSNYYALGMKDWEDEDRIKAVDKWIHSQDEENQKYLWRLVTDHRKSIENLFA